MKETKRGQSVMMFVTVQEPTDARTTKQFTEKISDLWQANFFNNHIEAQVLF
jgi:hypothetical protein